jgi:hypothetical protein
LYAFELLLRLFLSLLFCLFLSRWLFDLLRKCPFHQDGVYLINFGRYGIASYQFSFPKA